MCGFCGARDARDGFDTATRQRLAQAATRALLPVGVTVRSWSGRFVVSNATGRSRIVERVGDVAAAAATLSDRGAVELAALLRA